ncbi:MAG: VCBS repeat-containing protein [Planctomycetes bacterium]|nr:VCBS repeat-containing protein [Planctomycetota bacterium]
MNSLVSRCAPLLLIAGATAQESLDARVVIALDARPLEAVALRTAPEALAIVALDDGRLLGLRPGFPPAAPRELVRVPGVPRALLGVGDALLVACDRPAALHLLRLRSNGELALASTSALSGAPRALAESAGDARELLVVVGERHAERWRLEEATPQLAERFELPCAAPHAALALGAGRGLFLSARERALFLREPGGRVTRRELDALPRRALRLDAQRFALLLGTPLGGDRVELYSSDARELTPLGRFECAGPVCLDACSSDFDGDQVLDLAVLNAGHGQLELRRGARDGSFGAPHTFAVGQVPRRVLAWDADGDGRPGWLVLEPQARRLGVLENRGGRDASPARFATRAGPTAVVLEKREGRSPIAWVLCESEPGVQRIDGERSAFTATPGLSLVSPALLAGARERLWAYDLARRELLAFDAEGQLVRSEALALEAPLGPIACGGRIALAQRGASTLHLFASGTNAREDRALGFALQNLVVGADGTSWGIGATGEICELGAQRSLAERLPPGEVLACDGGAAEPRFALVRERELWLAAPGAEPIAIATLSAPPAALVLSSIGGESCFGALCPLAHTLETGAFRAAAPVLRYGIGLGARALARESAPHPAWWIASTFSDELLRATAR